MSEGERSNSRKRKQREKRPPPTTERIFPVHLPLSLLLLLLFLWSKKPKHHSNLKGIQRTQQLTPLLWIRFGCAACQNRHSFTTLPLPFPPFISHHQSDKSTRLHVPAITMLLPPPIWPKWPLGLGAVRTSAFSNPFKSARGELVVSADPPINQSINQRRAGRAFGHLIDRTIFNSLYN